MAHQAHNIPWNVLASNFKWRAVNHCKDGATDFHWRRKPRQSREITYFIKAFKKTILEHAETQRARCIDTIHAPEQDGVVLSDEVCQRIMFIFQHWHESKTKPHHHANADQIQQGGKCVLPQQQRHMQAFLQPRRPNDCYEFFRVNSEAYFNLEIIKMLLLYREMDVLWKICSHPDQDLASWWQAEPCCCATEKDLGWDMICKMALRAYLLLNLIDCFPETWQNDAVGEKNYRNTKLYQSTVRYLTKGRGNPIIAAYPHREFFGIPDNHFKKPCHLCGCLPYDTFIWVGGEAGYIPLPTEIDQVRQTLHDKRLPGELVDQIMSLAQYGKFTRRLPTPHDPFKPENRAELQKYLKYCWLLMVQSQVLGQRIGLDLKWEEMISEALVDMFTCACDQSGKRSYRWDWDNHENCVVFV
ncbi:hypothetical protein B0I35DRAFT_349777 [Stachybotrys elegans]|uniref:Uncharacterized protein n=1 Tax=Stachybotrys elegans TaxID=80388 RepID=A0A8K0SY66_9HYPO|nr:hypothetical protein B0I35DRAFT_349777 [Stachybotrys elegans]